MSVKLKYNISCWPDLKINYWGIPKCFNTSIKYALAEKSNKKLEKIDDTCKWIHQESLLHYIDRETALENNYINITLTRNPFDRFLSLCKDVQRRKSLGNKIGSKYSVDSVLNYIERTTEKKRDVHFRSQCYYICHGNKIIPDILAIEEFEDLIKTKVKKLNSIEKTIILTDEQKKRVYNLFKNDFELLRYSYE